MKQSILLQQINDDRHLFLEGFIRYLEQTSEDSWCTDVVKNADGTKNCLFGHLADYFGIKGDENASVCIDTFENAIASSYMVYPINDGKNPHYPQETPKQRCLAYLADLQSGNKLMTPEAFAAYSSEPFIRFKPGQVLEHTDSLTGKVSLWMVQIDAGDRVVIVSPHGKFETLIVGSPEYKTLSVAEDQSLAADFSPYTTLSVRA